MRYVEASCKNAVVVRTRATARRTPADWSRRGSGQSYWRCVRSRCPLRRLRWSGFPEAAVPGGGQLAHRRIGIGIAHRHAAAQATG